MPARPLVKKVRGYMDKHDRYLQLVQQRKAFRFTNGLLNPAQICGGKYDCDHVEPWARWQSNLDAKVLLIGQDFGGSNFFKEYHGDNNPGSQTNLNLMALFQSIGIELGPSNAPNPQAPVFLTNAIVGIVDADGKAGTLSKIDLHPEWIEESALRFIKPLIDLIAPKVIIAMSEVALQCLACIYPKQVHVLTPFRRCVEAEPVCVAGSYIFPVYHCTRGSINRNRNWDLQCGDWARIRNYL